MEVNLTETQRVAVKKHCGCIWEKDCNGKLYARIYPYDSFVRTVCADVLAKMDKRSERLVMALTSKDTFFNMVTGNWNFKTSDSAYCRGFADEAKTAMVKALDDLRTHEQAVVELATTRKLIKSLEYKPSDMWQIFEQSHKDMSERRKYQVRLAYDRFLGYCGRQGITDMSMVTREIVVAWLDEVSDGLSNRTWNGNLGDIRMVFSSSWRALGLDEEPTAAIKKKPKQTISRQPYSKADVDDVLRKLDKGLVIPYHYRTHGKVVVVNRPFRIPYNIIEVKAAILLAAYCGMRLVDAVSVRYEQYDGEFVRYTPSKTRKHTDEVVVPVVHKGLRKILAHGEGFVTPNLKALHDKSDSMCSRFFIRIFRACGYQTTIECEGRRRASIGGSHAMRHSYITWAIEDGVPLDVVSTCAGHNSIVQTAAYNHISAKRKAVEMGKIMRGAV